MRGMASHTCSNARLTHPHELNRNAQGAGVTESGIERKRLRLVPAAPEKGWQPVPGEIIEVNEDDCWWEARVMVRPL